MEYLNNPQINTLLQAPKRLRRMKALYFFLSMILLGVAIFLAIASESLPPKKFPNGSIVEVTSKDRAISLASKLRDENIIKNKTLFKVALVVWGGGHKILAGDYLFSKPENVWTVARRIVRGEQGLERIRVTIPEGVTVSEMAVILMRRLPDFDAPRFHSLAIEYEGYLFPDTYYFLPNVKAEEIIKTMRREFDKKMVELGDELEASGRTLEDIVTMASIIEEETILTEDKYLVSGILWKRLDKGMPLQVDATFLYINGKNTYGLTLDDLKIDSPYNTYKYKGLPKGPITNPGFDSLSAAISPKASPYWYYLNDLESKLHYAETYDKHLVNKARYVP